MPRAVRFLISGDEKKRRARLPLSSRQDEAAN